MNVLIEKYGRDTNTLQQKDGRDIQQWEGLEHDVERFLFSAAC